MKKIELLSPAGSMESVYAAVQNGADAVYLGGDKFSARAFAGNFDNNALVYAIEYCHLYGVKVYITINTLIKQCELDEVKSYLEFLYVNGADALIIQDLAIAEIVRTYFPDFEIHASTQMTVHNAEGAKLLSDLGFKRIVLSRELSLKEIRYISKDLNIETEVFIHGALCVCYSGQCLMSSIIGGRSGNRGRCAQPCRLPYSLIGDNGFEKSGYLLSPKDICLIGEIDKIIESGTCSLKIEGRMKKPEYVSGVTSMYRKAIDDAYLGRKDAKKIDSFNKKLLQLFNREGFSKGYFLGNNGSSMMAYKNPKNTGVYIGNIDKNGEILLCDKVSKGDGISSGSDGANLTKITKGGVEAAIGKKGEKVKLYPEFYKINDSIYKTQDLELLNECKKSFENIYSKKIMLDCSVQFQINKPITLIIKYMGNEFVRQGTIVEKPIKAPISEEKLVSNIKKTGNTPFSIDKIHFVKFEDGFLPISSINEVRRNIIDDISNFIINKYKRKVPNINLPNNISESKFKMPHTLISVTNIDQLNAVIECGYKDIAVNPFLGSSIFKETLKYNDLNIYIKIPNIIREEFESVCSIIDINKDNIKGILTSNLGIFNRYKNIIPLVGDYKSNIYNKLSWQYYSKIIESAYISVELSKKELKDVFSKSNMPLGMLIYGNIELMISEYCVIGAMHNDKHHCDKACGKSSYVLKDRKNENFKIATDCFCRSYIYNSVPLNLISNIEEIKNIGVENYRLDFTFENREETVKILKCYENRKWEQSLSGFTRGHFKRGVE